MLDSSGYIEWLLKFDKHISHDPIRNNQQPTTACVLFLPSLTSSSRTQRINLHGWLGEGENAVYNYTTSHDHSPFKEGGWGSLLKNVQPCWTQLGLNLPLTIVNENSKA